MFDFLSDKEDRLLGGINSFRKSANLTAFSLNDNAEWVAQKIADFDKTSNCTNPIKSPKDIRPGISDYPNAITKCHIADNTTKGVIVLPVCVPNLVPTLVITNFTRTHYSKYINDSSFTGIGIGHEKDLMVVLLSTNTTTGNLANGACSLLHGKFGLSYNYMVFLLLGFQLFCL